MLFELEHLSHVCCWSASASDLAQDVGLKALEEGRGVYASTYSRMWWYRWSLALGRMVGRSYLMFNDCNWKVEIHRQIVKQNGKLKGYMWGSNFTCDLLTLLL